MRSLHLLNAALLAAFAPALSAGTVFDNGASNLGGGYNISTAVTAEDFSLATATTLTGARFWATATTARTFAASFSGSVGWAIYANDGVNNRPGLLLDSGTDATPTLVNTGKRSAGSLNLASEEWQIDIDLLASVDAGTTYWLALHEGDWGSPDDGSTILWVTTGGGLGLLARQSPEETGPTSWASLNDGLAFQLFDGGEPVPEPGTWAAAGFVALAGAWTWRRRQHRH